MKNSLWRKDIIGIDELSKRDIKTILKEAEITKRAHIASVNNRKVKPFYDDTLKGIVITNLFYEPSTRTSSSFAASMQRLGGSVIQINNVKFSSVSKGESFADTIKTLEQYSDAIVLRHPEVGAAAGAAAVASIPIINAGDGIGEHPTQALLDLFTIQEEIGRVDDLRVAFVGDLKHGRTVHSLMKLLDRQDNVSYVTVSPADLSLMDVPGRSELRWEDNLNEGILQDIDVLYMTRIQRERFIDPSKAEGLSSGCILTRELAEYMPSDSVIMHPLPRVNEITIDVDELPNAAYFRQAQNGMYVRMALLHLILGELDGRMDWE